MTTPTEPPIPFVDQLRDQLAGGTEPALPASSPGRRWRVAAVAAAVVVVAAGIGIAVERDGDDEVEVAAPPAATPVLPVGDLAGFTVEEAIDWPVPGAATTDVWLEVWAAPGDGPVGERPSLVLLTVENPDIRDLAEEDVSSGQVVRGHAAEDAT